MTIELKAAQRLQAAVTPAKLAALVQRTVLRIISSTKVASIGLGEDKQSVNLTVKTDNEPIVLTAGSLDLLRKLLKSHSGSEIHITAPSAGKVALDFTGFADTE